jgi:hypothetical protein
MVLFRSVLREGATRKAVESFITMLIVDVEFGGTSPNETYPRYLKQHSSDPRTILETLSLDEALEIGRREQPAQPRERANLPLEYRGRGPKPGDGRATGPLSVCSQSD